MASEKQIEANRRNAQLSTGPRTEEGKAAAAFNALKHGFRSRVFVGNFQNTREYYELLHDLLAEFQPQTVVEGAYVERIAIGMTRLSFVEKLQNGCIGSAVQEKSIALYWQQLDRLERAFDRALNQLRKLQKDRARETAPQPAAEAPKPQPKPKPPASAPSPHPVAVPHPASQHPDPPRPVSSPPDPVKVAS